MTQLRVAGIDLGIHKIALSCIGDDPDGWSYTVTQDHRDLQLSELGAIAHDFCLLHQIDSVWVEDIIIGNNRKYSIRLAETMGAVLSDLAQLRMGNGLDIRRVDNKVWKKALIGNGNATKDDIRHYIDVTHPRYAPLCEGDQDLYDSVCIALYGRQVLDRAVDLVLPGRLADQDEPSHS